MTRKLFYLFFIVMFASLTSCSVFESDKTISASELDGEVDNLETETEDDFSDLEDLEPATGEAQATTDKGAYSEIEDFNNDLLDTQLDQAATEAPATQAGQPAPVSPEDDLDLEMADVNVAPTAPVGATSADNKITNLEYKSFESGGTVVISAEKPFEYKVRDEPQFNQTVLEIADIALPEKFKLPYIAKDFGQSVATINAYQDNGATTARIVIQYKTGTKPTIEQKNNTLLVMNSHLGTSDDAAVMGEDSLVDTSTVAATSTASGAPVGYVPGRVPENRPITLEMDDVEIREVIKLIADEVNINVIIDASIRGPTSVHLKGVPWEEALASILKAHSLGYVRQGNVMRIAPEDTLTKEATAYADRVTKEDIAKRTLATRKVKVFPVNYADVEDMAGKMNNFLTQTSQGGLPGKAVGDKRSNSIVVTDYEEVLTRIEAVVKSLDIPPLQVLLEGKIVEANENFTREFGLRWTSTNNELGLGGQTGTLITQNRSSVNPDTLPGGLFQSLQIGSFDILGEVNAVLGLMESESKVKILSSPKIMAMNKEKSIVKQATQLPIRQATVSNGVVTETVTFQDATLALEVTPQVTFNGDTILDVKVTRDVPGEAVANSRAMNKREASGKVLVKDGQTMVMGGIYSVDETNSETGIPWLKDIPILGYLFKSKSKTFIKNELVIFLTPKIVNPDIMKQMARLNQLKGGVDATIPSTPTSGKSENPDDLDQELDAL